MSRGLGIASMDILPSVEIFRELQDIHDTGYFFATASLDDYWQQVTYLFIELAAFSFLDHMSPGIIALHKLIVNHTGNILLILILSRLFCSL